ncbi:MAG: hypothetical protein Ta2D_10650 [Rickettsiales bacterium]|nr:MAG: hypothetical protein Ta2D_10650 [Rickettsiales bacterium]
MDGSYIFHYSVIITNIFLFFLFNREIKLNVYLKIFLYFFIFCVSYFLFFYLFYICLFGIAGDK